MKNWKESATLLVTCSIPSTQAAEMISKNVEVKESYKLLMMKRHGKSPYMPSKFVFPGGVLHSVDKNPSWKNLFENKAGDAYRNFLKKLTYTPSSYPIIKENMNFSLPADIVFRLCAIRETFEETGLLLVTNSNTLDKESDKHNSSKRDLENNNSMLPSTFVNIFDNDKKELETWRKKVTGNADEFLTLCSSLKVLPNIWALYEWSNWLTPIFKKNLGRFDAVFYVCCIYSEKLPNVQTDHYESTQLDWEEPSVFRKMASQGDKSLFMPPQVYELSELKHYPSLAALKQEAHKRTYEPRDRPRLFPVVRILKDGIVTLLPGDQLYEEWSSDLVFEDMDVSVDGFETTQGAVHRIIFKHNFIDGIVYKNI